MQNHQPTESQAGMEPSVPVVERRAVKFFRLKDSPVQVGTIRFSPYFGCPPYEVNPLSSESTTGDLIDDYTESLTCPKHRLQR
jgi:hypothetical protein